MATIQDLIDGFLLRTTSHPDLTTKGSELTHAEGDTVFITIYDFLKDMISGAALAPYNAGTTYTGTQYVSYGGNIYVHISGSPSTGVTPGTNPAVWELSSVGALMHVRNQDTHLAYGTASQVSAVDLYELLNNQTIQVTQAELVTAITSATIVPNRVYEITDLSYTSATLYLFSSSVRSLSNRGVLIMRVADPAQAGPWSPTATYAVNDYVSCSSYGLEVYKNLTGSNNPNTPPSGDGVNWQQQNKLLSSKYMWSFWDAQITIDIGGSSVSIENLTDKYGNQTGRVTIAPDPFLEDGTRYANQCDGGSSITGLQTLVGDCHSNTLIQSSVGSIGGDGSFYSNALNKAAITFSDTLDGSFRNNVVDGCSLVFTGGIISGVIIAGSKFLFTALQTVNVRATTALSGKTISAYGSDAQDTIVMSGATTVNLALNGVPDVFGEIILSSVNATETVNTFSNGARLFPIKIMPETGLTVTLNCTAYASVSAHGQVIAPSASYALNGSKGDYVILEPVTVGLYNVYRVKSSSIAL